HHCNNNGANVVCVEMLGSFGEKELGYEAQHAKKSQNSVRNRILSYNEIGGPILTLSQDVRSKLASFINHRVERIIACNGFHNGSYN
ncbi:MAG: hypothetical protein MI862_01240, partial [Desulfobacterales bacterium]|nr:hypothetical protein [Desulfobacterales bacterium]